MDGDGNLRAGAVMIRRKRAHDMEAVSDMARAIEDLAESHLVGAEVDAVEPSRIAGTYDWRAYLQEELAEARKREPKPKGVEKPERVVDTQPPSVFYA